jgi:FkbM family methyltransferase
MLANEFRPRRPFTVKRLPWLARFYLRAYHAGRMTSWLARSLRLCFPVWYRLCGSSTGEFDYERLGRRRAIRFNARNLQFQALYADFDRNGYEAEVAVLLDALLPETGVFFDIGANWGYFTLYSASNRDRPTIHAFEPMPATFSDLNNCVDQAELRHCVTCHRIALSHMDGEAFIQIPGGLHSGIAEVSFAGGTTRISTQRLDSMNLSPPDFIKMDVEDHEIEVLRGGIEVIRSTRPFIVFENKPNETAPEKALEPLFFLRELGYRLYAPVLQRKQNQHYYQMQVGPNSAIPGDLLVLKELEPEARLLWHRDLNVFACHESRLPQLNRVFPL